MQIFEVFGDLIFRDNNTRQRLQQVSGAVNSAQQVFNLFGSNVMNIGRSITNFGNMMIEHVTKPLLSSIPTGIQYNMLLEDQMTSFEVMLGGAKKAKSFMNEIVDMAAKTPFETTNLSDASKTLLGFGVESKNVIPIMSKLGDVSLGNEQKFKSLNLVMGQVRAGNRLTGGDLIQFINAGWNPLQEMVKMTGKSYKTLRKEMEEGNITFKDVSKALDHATGKGGQFYQGMIKGSQTLSGRLSTLKDNYMMLLGKATKPLFDFISSTAVPFLSKLLEGFDKLNPKVKLIITIFSGLLASIGPLAVVFGGIVTAIGALVAIIGTVGAPVIIAAAAFTALIPVVTAVGGVFVWILEKAGALKVAFNFVKDIITAVSAAIRGDGTQAFQILTEKIGISQEKATLFIGEIRRAVMAVQRVGEVARNTGKLIGLIFTGKQQAIIDLLVSKFNLSKKEAILFATKLQMLKDKARELWAQIKDRLVSALTTLATKVKTASKFIYDHRAEIAKAISRIIDFASKVVGAASKILSAASKIKAFADRVKSFIAAGVAGSINSFSKLVSKAGSVLNSIKNKIDAVKNAFYQVVSAVGSVISKIASISFPKPPSWFPGFAKGVTNFAGGVAMVGEEGPELVELPRGSNVIPHHKVKNYARQLQPNMDKTDIVSKKQDFYFDFKNMVIRERADADYLFERLAKLLKLKGVRIKNA